MVPAIYASLVTSVTEKKSVKLKPKLKNKSVKARKKGQRERKSFGLSGFLTSPPVCPKLFPGT